MFGNAGENKLVACPVLEPIRQLVLFGEGHVGIGFEDKAAIQFCQAILRAQLAVAYGLYTEYGWSPWSTAPGCGLG